MRLSNLSVAKKLIAAFSILASSSSSRASSRSRSRRASRRADAISDSTVLQAKSVNTVRSDAAKLQAAMRGLLVTGSSQYGKDFEAHRRFDADLPTASKAAVNETRRRRHRHRRRGRCLAQTPGRPAVEADATSRDGQRGARHRGDRRRRATVMGNAVAGRQRPIPIPPPPAPRRTVRSIPRR